MDPGKLTTGAALYAFERFGQSAHIQCGFCGRGPGGSEDSHPNIWTRISGIRPLQFGINVAIIVVVDLFIAAFTHWIITCYTNHDLIRLATETVRPYGPNLCFMVAFLLYHFQCITLLHCGMDFTFTPRHQWVNLSPAPNRVGGT